MGQCPYLGPVPKLHKLLGGSGPNWDLGGCWPMQRVTDPCIHLLPLAGPDPECLRSCKTPRNVSNGSRGIRPSDWLPGVRCLCP
ncbi:hypothetical protein FKM82_017229 [Ascaphus truei]